MGKFFLVVLALPIVGFIAYHAEDCLDPESLDMCMEHAEDVVMQIRDGMEPALDWINTFLKNLFN